MLYISFALLVVFSNVFAVHMAYAQRYAFVPSIVILIIMFEQCYNASNTFIRIIAILFVIITFVSNTRQLEKLDFMSTIAPDWQKEIEHWRFDHSYKPKVWPYRPGCEWEIDLARSKAAKNDARDLPLSLYR